jgi:pimeloyl-ACP methyl ester carboxylesterase
LGVALGFAAVAHSGETATSGGLHDRREHPDPGAPDTIVLIHGFWMTPRSWEKWAEHHEDKGYRVLTPTYPGFEGEVEALREDPSPIEALTIPAIIEHIGAS